jgi:hypothetical protein
MTVYQKLGGALGITAPAAGSIARSALAANFSGDLSLTYFKVVNTGAGPITLSWQTSGALTGDSNATVIGTGQTEYIQAASTSNTGTVYFYAGGTATSVVYITPIAIVI